MPSPETVPAYRHWAMNTNSTKLINTGPTLLHAVTINKKGATANVLTLYNGVDNTATEKFVLDTTAGVGQVPYDLTFDLGLYVELATGTAADLVITWLPG